MLRTITTSLSRNLTPFRHLPASASLYLHAPRPARSTQSPQPEAATTTTVDADPAALRRQSQAAAIADLQAIEANLFENSHRNRSQPAIDTQALLQKYAGQSAPKAFRSKSRHGAANKFRSSPAEQSAAPKPAAKPAAKVKSPIVHNTELDLSYTKLHLNDPWLPSLLLSVKSRKSRALKHQLLVEGRRLIVDALQAGLPLDYVLFSDLQQLQLLQPHLPKDTDDTGSQPRLVKVPQQDLRLWSQLSTCPGLMAVFTRPTDMDAVLWRSTDAQRLPLTVICDQIREPNNVGAVLRSCAAAGCAQVIVTKGCADPWESKALRGGAGAQFRVPVRGPCDWSSIGSMVPAGSAVFVAEASAERAAQLWEEVGRGRRSAVESEDVAEAKENGAAQLLRAYSEVAYDQAVDAHSDGHVVLVIGGETEGVSADAYRLLRRRARGGAVQVPLAGGVESLNAGAALAVVLFEIRRHLLAARGE